MAGSPQGQSLRLDSFASRFSFSSPAEGASCELPKEKKMIGVYARLSDMTWFVRKFRKS
jgi:hypothetical protein